MENRDIMCYILSNSELKYILSYSYYHQWGQFWNGKKIEIKSARRL